MNIKAIIFDYGEVLTAAVDPDAERAKRSRLASKLNLQAEELWPTLFEGETARLWMTGQLDWDTFWHLVLEPYGITDPGDIQVFSREALPQPHQLHPEMGTLLAELNGRYKLAVLSNSSWTEEKMQARLSGELGLPAGIFDVVVTSNSAGAVKPDSAIFLHTLSRLNVRPEEAIFTDDLPNFTHSATMVGIHAHTFTSPAAFRVFLEEMSVLQAH